MILLSNIGNTIKIATDANIEINIVTPIITLSSLSPKIAISFSSNFDGFESSSSSKKLAEYANVFIPNTNESTNANIPLRNGSPSTGIFVVRLSYLSSITAIVLSGFLTAVEYLSPFFIMIPSITACPPIPEYFISSPVILKKSQTPA